MSDKDLVKVGMQPRSPEARWNRRVSSSLSLCASEPLAAGPPPETPQLHAPASFGKVDGRGHSQKPAPSRSAQPSPQGLMDINGPNLPPPLGGRTASDPIADGRRYTYDDLSEEPNTLLDDMVFRSNSHGGQPSKTSGGGEDRRRRRAAAKSPIAQLVEAARQYVRSEDQVATIIPAVIRRERRLRMQAEQEASQHQAQAAQQRKRCVRLETELKKTVLELEDRAIYESITYDVASYMPRPALPTRICPPPPALPPAEPEPVREQVLEEVPIPLSIQQQQQQQQQRVSPGPVHGVAAHARGRRKNKGPSPEYQQVLQQTAKNRMRSQTSERRRLTRQLRHTLKRMSYSFGGQDPRRLFETYDRDNSGDLDFKEFSNAVRKGGGVTRMVMSDKDLVKLYGFVDVKTPANPIRASFLDFHEFKRKLFSGGQGRGDHHRRAD